MEETVVSAVLFLLTFLGFRPQKVGNELDAATNERMRQRAEEMQERMMWLLSEIERKEQKRHRHGDMQDVLLSVLLRWQFWFCIGVLVVFFWYLWRLLRRIRVPESSSEESSSSEEEVEERVQPNPNNARNLAEFVAQRIYMPLPNPAIRRQQAAEVVGELLRVFGLMFSNTFFPEMQPAIRVGSAFEGWSPRENDTVYRLLVPMTPPRGHSFYLELGDEDDMPARNSIHVQLECACARERDFGDMLCFLHHSEEELKDQEPSLLDTLCTNSYLDAEKIARLFQNFVKKAWEVMPQSLVYKVKVLPSTRSCKLRLKNAAKRNLSVEIIFGVQQDDSDIFLSSQRTEAIFTPSTTWPQSCAVAEIKFFRYMANEAWFNTLHLKCLQTYARMLLGTSITTYIIKTIVMHLLTTIPLEMWQAMDFLPRLDDIMRYLRCCVEEKRLNHFFFGNEMVPDVIVLPPAFQLSGPVNLFQHLEQDTHAYTRMLQEFQELRNRLTRLIIFGH